MSTDDQKRASELHGEAHKVARDEVQRPFVPVKRIGGCDRDSTIGLDWRNNHRL
jgi:hypothetical protein